MGALKRGEAGTPYELCIGNLIKGSGFDDALVETELFGMEIVEQVIHGSHYDRSLRGVLIF